MAGTTGYNLSAATIPGAAVPAEVTNASVHFVRKLFGRLNRECASEAGTELAKLDQAPPGRLQHSFGTGPEQKAEFEFETQCQLFDDFDADGKGLHDPRTAKLSPVIPAVH